MAEMTVRERFGARVRAARVALDLDLAQVAWKTQLSVPLLERIEAGQHDPDLDEIERLSKALNVPLPALIDDLLDTPPGTGPAKASAPTGLAGTLRSLRDWLRRG